MKVKKERKEMEDREKGEGVREATHTGNKSLRSVMTSQQGLPIGQGTPQEVPWYGWGHDLHDLQRRRYREDSRGADS